PVVHVRRYDGEAGRVEEPEEHGRVEPAAGADDEAGAGREAEARGDVTARCRQVHADAGEEGMEARTRRVIAGRRPRGSPGRPPRWSGAPAGRVPARSTRAGAPLRRGVPAPRG